jgi:8-oxo-dGTP pyrophosphatase MutT (NUDIX family)
MHLKFRNIITNEFVSLPLNYVVQTRVSVYGIVKYHKQENKFLLVRDGRSNKLEFSGGGIDIGETLSDALTREVLEETGFVVQMGNIIHASTECIYHPPKDVYFSSVCIFAQAKLCNTDVVAQNLDSPDEIVSVFFGEIKKESMLQSHYEAFVKNLE